MFLVVFFDVDDIFLWFSIKFCWVDEGSVEEGCFFVGKGVVLFWKFLVEEGFWYWEFLFSCLLIVVFFFLSFVEWDLVLVCKVFFVGGLLEVFMMELKNK